MACGRPAEAGHAADVACGRAGVRTWRAAARAGAQAAEVSLTYVYILNCCLQQVAQFLVVVAILATGRRRNRPQRFRTSMAYDQGAGRDHGDLTGCDRL